MITWQVKLRTCLPARMGYRHIYAWMRFKFFTVEGGH
jgi:hypothetical protein